MEMAPETKRFVLRIPKAMRFMGTGKNPKPLTKKEVNQILGRKKETETVTSEMNFIVGSRVKIIAGPFNDFLGAIRKINSEKEKLVVDVTVFGRVTPVEVRFNQVELLD